MTGSVVRREPCPECGSSDNVAVYEDGHRHCFGIGCGYHTAGHGEQPQQRRARVSAKFIEGDFRALKGRCLTAEACRKFGVRLGKLDNEVVLAMDHHTPAGVVCAQKVRKEPKAFTIIGDIREAGLFGQHLWSGKGRRVVVTEGELDAVALCQADGLKWPVVSLKNGAGSARKDLAAAREWLEGYDEVVLAFDADEAGLKAAADGAAALSPGKVRIADFRGFGFKDANEAVQKSETEHDPSYLKNLLKAIWEARPWRPDGVVSLKDIRAAALAKLVPGRPWPWPLMTRMTSGRRMGEIHTFGAGTGIGKTDLITQTVAHDVSLGYRCGILSFEQHVAQTGRRIAGKMNAKRFHVLDGSWSDDEYEAAWDRLEETDMVHFYDSFGVTDWPAVKAMILYMVDVLGCEHVFLDNFTAIVAGEADENAALKVIMGDCAKMALNRFILHAVSHLARPEGKAHEEGGRVSLKHFRGSHTIVMGSNFVYGLERDKTADDPTERATLTVRCLKDRDTGNADGESIELLYNRETGMLEESGEADNDNAVSADAVGF